MPLAKRMKHFVSGCVSVVASRWLATANIDGSYHIQPAEYHQSVFQGKWMFITRLATAVSRYSTTTTNAMDVGSAMPTTMAWPCLYRETFPILSTASHRGTACHVSNKTMEGMGGLYREHREQSMDIGHPKCRHCLSLILHHSATSLSMKKTHTHTHTHNSFNVI